MKKHTAKKMVYVLKQKETGNILFQYTTNQGTAKKALFNSPKLAQDALNQYIRRTDLEIVALGEEDDMLQLPGLTVQVDQEIKAIQQACAEQHELLAHQLAQAFNEQNYQCEVEISKQRSDSRLRCFFTPRKRGGTR